MQKSTREIERMLESADPKIQRHRGHAASLNPISRTSQVQDGWIVYSVGYTLAEREKGWRIELLDTTRPFQDNSIRAGSNPESLDAAIEAANRKIRPV